MPATKTEKVTVLITVESIIAGFMIAYGALNMQMLAHWAKEGAPLVGTAVAGIWIYAIVLTCFVSILFLYCSLDTDSKYGSFDVRYAWGFCLFCWIIVLSTIYVGETAHSIYRLTVRTNCMGQHAPWCYPDTLATLTWNLFKVYVLSLFLLCAAFIFADSRIRKNTKEPNESVEPWPT